MKIGIIKVGNSKGIRIPKALLDACEIGDAVELEVIEGKLVLSPLKNPREGWEESFKADPPDQDEGLLLGEFTNEFDDEEWEW